MNIPSLHETLARTSRNSEVTTSGRQGRRAVAAFTVFALVLAAGCNAAANGAPANGAVSLPFGDMEASAPPDGVLVTTITEAAQSHPELVEKHLGL